MKSPFPGMDPYLEAHDIWPDFHNALACQLSETLNAVLPQPYYARLNVRSEIGIVDKGQPQWRAEIHTETYEVPFLEIRDPSRHHRLVTLIEIISPSNKHSGPDRDAYMEKQWEVLHSDANLIELDLLRSGKRLLPEPELEIRVDEMACDYLMLLNRHADRKGYRLAYWLYPVDVRELLPCLPVPLTDPLPDVPLDLNVAVERTYLGGPYARLLDYTLPPNPPLNDDDARWAEAQLQQAGLRPA